MAVGSIGLAVGSGLKVIDRSGNRSNDQTERTIAAERNLCCSIAGCGGKLRCPTRSRSERGANGESERLGKVIDRSVGYLHFVEANDQSILRFGRVGKSQFECLACLPNDSELYCGF